MVDFFIQRQCSAWYFPGEITQEFRSTNDLRCVAIDDVEQLDEAAQIEMFGFYNQLRNDGNTFLLVSGSVAPSQLKT